MHIIAFCGTQESLDEGEGKEMDEGKGKAE